MQLFQTKSTLDVVAWQNRRFAGSQLSKLAYNNGLFLVGTSMSQSNPVVTPSAYLTLHYRLASKEGANIVSTFEENPATLQLGTGQLAPFLEACLVGLPEGAHQVFDLPPENAFGPRNPDLIQRVSRATLEENSAAGEQYAIGDLIEFAAPSGGRFAGVLRAIDEDGALFDFNHPLAGQTVKFEVKIIGIL
jgi:FKBP-type peptidyl-prolyl cis-trans isomerase SlpA